MEHVNFSSATDKFIRLDCFNPVRAFIYVGLMIILIKLLWSVIQNNLRYSNLPQPPLSPVLGTLFGHLEHYFYLDKKTNPVKFFGPFVFDYARKLQSQGEGLMRLKFGPFHNVILIINGKTAEKILNQKATSKPSEYGLLSPLLGNGLVMSNGSAWKAARRALVPAFNQANLNRILPIMNEKSLILTNILDEQFNESNQFVIDDIQPLMINLSIDLILASSMGINLNAQTNWAEKNLKQQQKHETPEERYHRSLEISFDIIMQRILNPWYKNSWFFNNSTVGQKFAEHVKVVREFTTDVILKRKRQLEDDGVLNGEHFQPDDVLMPVLDLMLKYNSENSSVFDVESICDQVTTLIFGGHDTSATTSTYFFWRIGTLPRVQEKLHQEIDQVFHGDTEREITLDDIRQMPYLEACLKESLRLFPPIALYGRHIQEDIQCGRHVIPKDATVIVMSSALHRDPLAYNDPNHFKPERFLGSNYKFHQGAYLPFGTGARVCIGFTYAMQSLKVLFAQILRKYELESLISVNDARFSYSINSKISSPLPIRIRKRIFAQQTTSTDSSTSIASL